MTAKKAVAKKVSDEDTPKEVNVLAGLPKPEALQADQSKGLYPEGVQTFSYQPKDGSAPLVLALNGYEPPDKLWLFDMAQLPRLAQTWRWMDRVNIPKQVQRQAQMLPDAEYFEMFDAWFEAMKNAAGGGPKGAVTSGK